MIERTAPIENRITVHAMQATLLHLMGVNHASFTVKFQGCNCCLAGVHGNVLHNLIA